MGTAFAKVASSVICHNRGHGSTMKIRMIVRLIGSAIVGGTIVLLAACGEGEQEPSAEERQAIVTVAKTLVPGDADLAEVYKYSCYSCHANPQSGAPLTADIAAWEPRLAKGMHSLLEGTINGFQGMPPLGMCMECTEGEFITLIQFMSRTETGGNQ